RERREDIGLLLATFLKDSAHALGKAVPVFPPELVVLLTGYPFPGNVRELKAMVVDAVAQHTARVLSMESFEKIILRQSSPVPSSNTDWQEESIGSFPTPLPTLQQWSDQLIQEALRRSGGNQRVAATMLGISRHTIMRWEQAQQRQPTQY
ncbi:MAG: sigma-54-dependent Fis family transcriptional regulator, partial [Magnetococcales bacterium]|nr:sigma-54-dependent Fis family transcriptional regulator [Magnetococcales bacterium]